MADVPLTPPAPPVAADPNAQLATRITQPGDISVVDRETGDVRRVAAEDAAAGFRAGRYALPSTTPKVVMVAPDGDVGEVDSGKVGEALDSGFVIGDRAAQTRVRATNDKTTAFVEGLGRAVTGGLTDVAVQQAVANLGFDPATLDDYRARAETGASTAGQALGFGAGVLGADAASFAARGLSKLVETTALGAAARATAEKGAQAALSKVVGDRIASAAVRQGLGRAAQAGTEGFLYGMGGELSEQALGPDPQYNVEQLLAHGLMGGLIGSAMDIGFAAPGIRRSLASKAKFGGKAMPISEDALMLAREAGGVVNLSDDALGAAVSRLTGEELPEAGKGILGRMWRGLEEKVIDPIAAAGSGMTPAELRELRSAKNLKYIREGKQGVEAVGRQLKGALDDMYRMGEEDSKLVFNSLRPHLREQALAGVGTPEVVESVAGALRGLRNQLDDLVAKQPGVTAERANAIAAPFRQELEKIRADAWEAAGVKPLEGIREVVGPSGKTVRRKFKLDSLEDLANHPDADHSKVVGLLYDRADRLKGFLGKPGKFGDEVADSAAREIQSKFQDMYHGLRGHLEDEAVWGTLGTAQKELNAAAHSRIQALEELQKVFKFNRGEVDPGSVMSHLNALKGLRGDRGVAALDAFVAAQNRFAQAVEKHFDGVAMSGPTKALSERMAAIRDELGTRVRAVNLAQEMVNAENQRLGGGMMFGGALAGGVYGGLPGAAAGAVMGGWLRPGRQLVMRAHMGHMLDNVGDQLRARVGKAWEDVGERAARLTPSPELVERGLARSTIKMLQGSPQERRAAYKERVAQLDRLADPGNAAATGAPAMRALNANAPMHATYAQAKAAQAVQVLRDRYPGVNPGRNPIDPLEPRTALETPEPTDRDIERFARADAIATNPQRLILDPHVTPDEVKVVETLYPGYLQAVRTELGNVLAAKTKPLTKTQRAHAATIMGTKAYKPERIAKWQSLYKVPISQGGPAHSGSTPRTSKNPRSAGLAPLSDQAVKR